MRNGFGWYETALDAAYHNEGATNENKIIEFVSKVYDEYDHTKINRIWLTLMSVMNEIIDHGGGNNFKIPHLNKENLERRNLLPTVLNVMENVREYFI